MPATSSAVASCTRESARCADARHYTHALAECCRGHVREITRHVTEALTAAGVPFWADYGTLLGAVRNPMTTAADYPWLALEHDGPLAPGIVPHDKDSDLGALFTDWNEAFNALRRLAEEQQYDLVTRPHRASMKMRLSNRNHTNCDIFFWYERPDGTMYRRLYASVDAFKGKEFHRDQLFPLGVVEWEGITLPAPRDPEAFLLMRYGERWRTPLADNNDGVQR